MSKSTSTIPATICWRPFGTRLPDWGVLPPGHKRYAQTPPADDVVL